MSSQPTDRSRQGQLESQEPDPDSAKPENETSRKETSQETSKDMRKGSSTTLLSFEHAEKLFGELAPLARVLSRATRVLDEETRLVGGSSSLSVLHTAAQQKEALLTQHDLQVLRLQSKAGDLASFVATLDAGVRSRLRTLYAGFEEALRKNGLRLKAALASSEMLLEALSEAAQAESAKGPQLYTPQGRLSETDSVSLAHSTRASHEV